MTRSAAKPISAVPMSLSITCCFSSIRRRNASAEKNSATKLNHAQWVNDINRPYAKFAVSELPVCTTWLYVATTNNMVLGLSALVKKPVRNASQDEGAEALAPPNVNEEVLVRDLIPR
ncbi:hypothetical protein D9M72_559920 [compost metagenome]